jgi:hypothetical protein
MVSMLRKSFKILLFTIVAALGCFVYVLLPFVSVGVERFNIGGYDVEELIINAVTVAFFFWATIHNSRSVVAIIEQPLSYVLFSCLLMLCLATAAPTSIYNNIGMIVLLVHQAISVAIGSFFGVVWSYARSVFQKQ